MLNPWTYLGSMSTSALLSDDKVPVVELFGQPVRAEVGAVRRLMAAAAVGASPFAERHYVWLGDR